MKNAALTSALRFLICQSKNKYHGNLIPAA
jgi:hypothetical protein